MAKVLYALGIAALVLFGISGCSENPKAPIIAAGENPELYHSRPNCDTAAHLEALVRMVIENRLKNERALRDVNATSAGPVCSQRPEIYPLVIDADSRATIATLSHQGRAYAFVKKVRVIAVILPHPTKEIQYIELDRGEDGYQYIVEPNMSLSKLDWMIIGGGGQDAKLEAPK